CSVTANLVARQRISNCFLLAQDQAPGDAGQVPVHALQAKPRGPEKARYDIALTPANLYEAPPVGPKKARQIGRQRAIGIEPIGSPGKREPGIELAHLVLQSCYIASWHIGRIAEHDIVGCPLAAAPVPDLESAAPCEAERSCIGLRHNHGARTDINPYPACAGQFT